MLAKEKSEQFVF